MPLPSSFWNQFIEKLSKQQSRLPVLYSILKQSRIIELENDRIKLACHNPGAKIYLEQKRGDVEKEIYDFVKKNLSVEFVLAEPKKRSPSPPLLSFEPAPEDLYARSGLSKKYSFENFAVSGTNQVAYAAAQAVVNNPGTAYNPLFLYGGVGVGKTHLAQAAAKKIIDLDKNKKIFFCPGDNFTNEMIESIREKTTGRFRRKYRQLDLLIIDDIQFIAGKEAVQEEFFHTFNSIVSSGGQIILTSDRPPSSIKNLEDRLRSRFSGGLIVDVQEPDFELRTAILLIKAKEKNIPIEIEAAKIIAERILDSRAIEGVLLSIYARTLGLKETVDLEAVDLFFSKDKETKNKKTSPNDVIRAVSTFYNIKKSQMKGISRTESVSLARQTAMYILRHELGLKLNEIAMLLKRKDHTTVLHGEQKIAMMIMKNPVFKKEVDSIIQSLYQST